MSSLDNNDTKCIKPTKANHDTQIGFYDIISTIGHGNFAVCKLAQHRLTKTLVRFYFILFLSSFKNLLFFLLKVAIKFIDKTNLDATHLSRLYKEIEIMKCVNHRNIIKLYQVYIVVVFVLPQKY